MTDECNNMHGADRQRSAEPFHIFAQLKDVIEAKLKGFDLEGLKVDASFSFVVIDALLTLFGRGGMGSPIVPLPQHLIDLVTASNRIVSFVLDEATHFGTGILVGPSHVLTAAHLFFEENGTLIDRHRLTRITIEARRTLAGNFILEGEPRKVALYKPTSTECFIDPFVINDVAQREVFFLDFVIVRLDRDLGSDPVGQEPRGWFEIPTSESAELLVTDLSVRTLQFLDRGPLLTSSGVVREVRENGYRVLHSASTADSSSGSPVVNEKLQLVAMHVGGSSSGERPKSNRAIPMRRIAETIDQSSGGSTVRERIRQ